VRGCGNVIGERKAAGAAGFGDNFVEMLLVNGDLARVQAANLRFVTISAGDMVPYTCEART
jgi:hypothetical protein